MAAAAAAAAARRVRRVAVLGGGISGLTLAYYLRALPRMLRQIGSPLVPAYDTHVTVVERAPRFGGWIETVRYGDGIEFDAAARSLHAHRTPDALALIGHLQLGDRVVLSSPLARRRFLWEAKGPGAPRLVHASPQGLLLRPPHGLSRVRLALGVLAEPMAPPCAADDESVHAFAARRLRNPALADTLIDPLMAGIYAGDARKLSVRSCLRQMWLMEQQHGSLLAAALHRRYGNRFGAKPVPPDAATSVAFLFEPPAALLSRVQDKARGGGLYSFRGGMEALPRALHDALRADADATGLVSLRAGTAAANLEFGVSAHNPQQRVARLDLQSAAAGSGSGGSGGTAAVEEFDAVYSTLRSDSLADVLQHTRAAAPLAPAPSATAAGGDAYCAQRHADLLADLRGVEYASVVVAHVAFASHALLPAAKRGFGVLIASGQPCPALGITFDSCVFPDADASGSGGGSSGDGGRLRFTVMLGGGRAPELNALPEEQLKALALQALRQVLGIDAAHTPPLALHIRRAVQCIPQMYVGHSERVARIHSAVRALCGADASAAAAGAAGGPAPLLTAMGTFANGVSVNDCVLHSQRAAAHFHGLAR